MDGIGNWVQLVLGLGLNSQDLASWQMAVRG
jgi:hypothetical protein